MMPLPEFKNSLADYLPDEPKIEEDWNLIDFQPTVADQTMTKPKVQNDLFYTFCELVSDLRRIEDDVGDEISEIVNCEFETRKQDVSLAKSLLTEEEIKKICSVLEWYTFMRMGHIMEFTWQELKQKLGISFVVELIAPSRPELTESEIVTIDHLGVMLEEIEQLKQTIDKSDYSDIFKKISHSIFNGFIDSLEPSIIVDHIEVYFKYNSKAIDIYASYFQQLSLRERLLWSIFISAVVNQLAFNSEGITSAPNQWPVAIPKNILPLVQDIDYRLSEMRKNGSTVTSVSLTIEANPTYCPFELSQNVAQNFPHSLPNWMGNGGQTCYISSVLWPLALIEEQLQGIETDVQEGEQKENVPISENQITDVPAKKRKVLPQSDEIDGAKTNFIASARTEFSSLFSLITSKEKKKISGSQVDRFRKAMQKAFPEVFSPGSPMAQEDAHDFLVCVMQSLLKLETFSENAPKFKTLHKFQRTDHSPLIGAENYDYETALQSVYRNEPMPIVSIRLKDKSELGSTSLKELITDVRVVDQMERHAYLMKETVEGPKFRALAVTHTEQLLVEDEENAPKYFIGMLARFGLDPLQNTRQKRFDTVTLDSSLQFPIKGQEEAHETVDYDLVAVTVHQGGIVDQGHYYTYLRMPFEGEWRYYRLDDIYGVRQCSSQEVNRDASKHGYLFFYKKKQHSIPQQSPRSDEKIETAEKLPPTSVDDGTSQLLQNKKESTYDIQGEYIAQLEVQYWTAANNLGSLFVVKDNAAYATLAELFFSQFPNEFTEQCQSLTELLSEQELLKMYCQNLQRPIFVVDREKDHDLYIIESYPIPGDQFRYGQEFNSNILYLIRQKAYWMVLHRLE